MALEMLGRFNAHLENVFNAIIQRACKRVFSDRLTTACPLQCSCAYRMLHHRTTPNTTRAASHVLRHTLPPATAAADHAAAASAPEKRSLASSNHHLPWKTSRTQQQPKRPVSSSEQTAPQEHSAAPTDEGLEPALVPTRAGLKQLPKGADSLVGWRVLLLRDAKVPRRKRAGGEVGTVQEVRASAAGITVMAAMPRHKAIVVTMMSFAGGRGSLLGLVGCIQRPAVCACFLLYYD